MGEREPHIDTHGPHVGWMIFQKKLSYLPNGFK